MLGNIGTVPHIHITFEQWGNFWLACRGVVGLVDWWFLRIESGNWYITNGYKWNLQKTWPTWLSSEGGVRSPRSSGSSPMHPFVLETPLSWTQTTQRNGTWYPWRIHGAGIYANMNGVYGWDPWHTIYSSTVRIRHGIWHCRNILNIYIYISIYIYIIYISFNSSNRILFNTLEWLILHSPAARKPPKSSGPCWSWRLDIAGRNADATKRS